jgi:hypothetical protein
MRSGEHDVARAYVLYRAKQMEERRAAKEARAPPPSLHRKSTCWKTASASRWNCRA